MVRRRRSASGARRFEDAPEAIDLDLTEAMIEREPVTVVVSKKGWIRALKGHVQDLSTLQFKGDDELGASFFAQTTSKILRARYERQGLYARCLETSRRARTWRADPPLRRDRGRRRCRRRSAACRRARRCCSCTNDGRGFVVEREMISVVDAQGHARLLNVEPPREIEDRDAGAGRSCRDHRREPQAAGLSA